MTSTRLRDSVPLLLIVGGGVLLRLLNIAWGLPDFNEEAIPFRRALRLWGMETGRLDLNPHFFNYPSLSIYLHGLIQLLHAGLGRLLGVYGGMADYALAYLIDPTPMVVAARGLGVLADAFTIAGCYRLGLDVSARAGRVAAGIVAASPVMILTGRAIYSDSIAAALVTWTAVFVIAYLREGRARWLLGAGITCGLAVGTKYPSIVVLALVVAALWTTRSRLGAAKIVALIAVPFLAFVSSTPFALLDPRQFVGDALYEVGHLSAGHLGGSAGPLGPARVLLSDLGPVGLALLVSSLVLAIRGGADAGVTRLLWGYELPMLIILLVARISADRYFTAVLPVGAVLAAGALQSLLAKPQFVDRRIRLAILAGLLLPILISGIRAAAGGGNDSQVRARHWCETHVGGGALVIQEALSVNLPTLSSLNAIRESRVFAEAGPRWKERLLSQRTFSIVSIPFVTSGIVSVPLAPPGGPGRDVAVFAPGERMNGVFYQPLLLSGTDYFITSSGVRGRYERDPGSYPLQMRWYGVLDRSADRIATFNGEEGTSQPTLNVYRLPPALQSRLMADSTSLSTLWWLETSRAGYRDTARTALADPYGAASLNGAWNRALQDLFALRFRAFARQLALEYARHGRARQARDLALATLQMDPIEAVSFRTYLVATMALRGSRAGRQDVEQLLSALEGRDPRAAGLRGEYARWIQMIERR